MNKILADKLWNMWFALPHCRLNQRTYHASARRRLEACNREISIISTNCIGGEIYSALGLRFDSPFINCSINRNQFVDLCCNLRAYMDSELIPMSSKSGEIVAQLGGNGAMPPVTIRFPHDNNWNTIWANWNRRKSRLRYDKLVLICDDQGLTEDNFRRFEQIKCYRKVILTAQPLSSKYQCTHCLTVYAGRQCTGEYQKKTMGGLHYFEYIWDYVAFLNGKEKEPRLRERKNEG